ncbi:helix-turn-helix domain-containing protein [Hungatella effluvii]|uniref:helix-turn-helix domain-containing protein n=1 Tax=Hungatella effluvii TaxID=1096246 RepID=UPI0022E0EB03|nr:helix-turn-helix transcriptional regulator [Hungatella effluvii]
MIKFDKLFELLQEKGISQYKLYTNYGISRNQIDRLKKNKNTSTVILSRLCKILNCRLEDIAEYVPGDDDN